MINANKICRRRQGNHHQSICERPFQSVGSTPPVRTNSNLAGESRKTKEEPTEPNDKISNSALVNHTTTTSAKGSFKVFLRTAATYAHDLTTRAQSLYEYSWIVVLRGLVTTAFKERLKLVPLKTETLNLNTFGDERFTKQLCDLVKLSLRGKEEDV